MAARRRLARVAALVLALGGAWGVAWWPTSISQGINGAISEIRLPLWVKATEFVVRDYHYRRLARQITRRLASPQEKALAIVEWTRAHLRPQPRELPTVDDHVYSIIVRGYGTSDQFADVVSTLCAYAGIPAMMNKLSAPGGDRLYVTLVQVDGRWCPLDPYHGVLFQHEDGRLASLEELTRDPGVLASTRRGPADPWIDYGKFIRPGLEVSTRSPRPYNHMPWTRVWQEMTRGFRS